MTMISRSDFPARHPVNTEDNSALWQLGLVTDRRGRVHLGAILRAAKTTAPMYIDLLAPVGANSPADLDLTRLAPLVRGEHLADLRRIVDRCIEHPTLKARLLALVDSAWTG